MGKKKKKETKKKGRENNPNAPEWRRKIETKREEDGDKRKGAKRRTKKKAQGERERNREHLTTFLFPVPLSSCDELRTISFHSSKELPNYLMLLLSMHPF